VGHESTIIRQIIPCLTFKCSGERTVVSGIGGRIL
jgi:hypothetical protein